MSGFMAVRISVDNLLGLSLVNGGVAPSSSAIGDYFVFPYDYDSFCEILSEEDFVSRFRFTNTENDKFFVDCELIN